MVRFRTLCGSLSDTAVRNRRRSAGLVATTTRRITSLAQRNDGFSVLYFVLYAGCTLVKKIDELDVCRAFYGCDVIAGRLDYNTSGSVVISHIVKYQNFEKGQANVIIKFLFEVLVCEGHFLETI
jgi:hypothetical protein